VKVSEGLRRISALGFRTTGSAGYGLRRMLVSEDGRRKQVLREGERKSIARDRVILVPGPKNEVQHVREIFKFTKSGVCTQNPIVSEMAMFRQLSEVDCDGNRAFDDTASGTLVEFQFLHPFHRITVHSSDTRTTLHDGMSNFSRFQNLERDNRRMPVLFSFAEVERGRFAASAAYRLWCTSVHIVLAFKFCGVLCSTESRGNS
jgi:hypothetical protein